MPKKLERCVRKVHGKHVKNAWAVCVKSTGLKPHHMSHKKRRY